MISCSEHCLNFHNLRGSSVSYPTGWTGHIHLDHLDLGHQKTELDQIPSFESSGLSLKPLSYRFGSLGC